MASTDHDLTIRTTNRLATYAVAALVYWVITFLVITVFDLKIFRERMTEMFFLSLLGIFAILGGAVVLNVMSNLSKISGKLSSVEGPAAKLNWKRVTMFLLPIPIVIACLFAGNEFSAQKKKDLLIASAERFVAENQSSLISLAQYKFSPDYVKSAEKTLGVLNKIDKNFPEVMIIFPDSIEEKELFLGFGGRHYRDEKEAIEKSAYIYSTSKDEREYLQRAFTKQDTSYRFHAEKGNYQLYFPVNIEGKRIVVYFSDFQRYGKFGS